MELRLLHDERTTLTEALVWSLRRVTTEVAHAEAMHLNFDRPEALAERIEALQSRIQDENDICLDDVDADVIVSALANFHTMTAMQIAAGSKAAHDLNRIAELERRVREHAKSLAMSPGAKERITPGRIVAGQSLERSGHDFQQLSAIVVNKFDAFFANDRNFPVPIMHRFVQVRDSLYEIGRTPHVAKWFGTVFTEQDFNDLNTLAAPWSFQNTDDPTSDSGAWHAFERIEANIKKHFE